MSRDRAGPGRGGGAPTHSTCTQIRTHSTSLHTDIDTGYKGTCMHNTFAHVHTCTRVYTHTRPCSGEKGGQRPSPSLGRVTPASLSSCGFPPRWLCAGRGKRGGVGRVRRVQRRWGSRSHVSPQLLQPPAPRGGLWLPAIPSAVGRVTVCGLCWGHMSRVLPGAWPGQEDLQIHLIQSAGRCPCVPFHEESTFWAAHGQSWRC